MIVNEITLVGSSRGPINVEDMISRRGNLADAPQAFELTAKKGTLKVLLASAARHGRLIRSLLESKQR